jgi:hypothetical protein
MVCDGGDDVGVIGWRRGAGGGGGGGLARAWASICGGLDSALGCKARHTVVVSI